MRRCCYFSQTKRIHEAVLTPSEDKDKGKNQNEQRVILWASNSPNSIGLVYLTRFAIFLRLLSVHNQIVKNYQACEKTLPSTSFATIGPGKCALIWHIRLFFRYLTCLQRKPFF